MATMWAITVSGMPISFIEPLRVGDVVTRTSTIKEINLKPGSTGLLCFVSVDHVFSTPRGVATRERHNIVYREMPAAGQNLRDNFVAVFAARVVVGDDDAVRQLFCDRAHLRAFALVAFAASTEDADQFAAAVCAQTA